MHFGAKRVKIAGDVQQVELSRRFRPFILHFPRIDEESFAGIHAIHKIKLVSRIADLAFKQVSSKAVKASFK